MFTHLHCRSWFSFLAGGSSPESLAMHAASLGMGALALTDRNGVYGVVRFQRACRAAGIKPIVGAEVSITEPTLGSEWKNSPLILLARSPEGYANLCRILTAAHLASRDEPAVGLDVVAEHAQDLICLTAGRDGYLYRMVADRQRKHAERWLGQLREIFDDRLYVELAHYYRPHDSAMVRRLHELASQLGIATVAAGDVRYAKHDDYGRYDLLTCIRLGVTIYQGHPERPVNGESYLKNEAQLRRIIPFPEAFENAVAIGEACNVDLLPGYITTPSAIIPDGISSADRLRMLCETGFQRRYPRERTTEEERTRARAQLEKELRVIGDLTLEEFFLVVHEVTDEAAKRRIRCAGRGSAANSLVAYLLGITHVDPLEHRLLFERFLHGGRKSMPDIDVDFDSDRRPEIIAWMEERFGIEQTAMTATVISYRLRMAVRDVAKALGWPEKTISDMAAFLPHYGTREVRSYRDQLAKVVGESVLLDALITMTESLDGCPRHLSLHSGGMVLSREPLYRFTPVQVSANGVKEIQFDKDDLESLGLVKLDVLGLRMLAAVSEAEEIITRTTGEHVDVETLTMDDPAVYDMICSGNTLGIFQIESMGQMHLIAQHQPREFNDLVTEVALFRPGPLQSGMVHPFNRRRKELEPITYDHPDLKPILADTYGVVLFQEQVLEIAHQFAGMSLEEADRFRSLMSKFREPQEMESMRERFVAGAIVRGVDEESANLVFNRVAHFVGYGFCRSHAAAFARTVYHSAWLKLYHPAAFMAALMQHRPGMYSLSTLEQEAIRFGVPVLMPEINRSGVRYQLERSADGALVIRKPLVSVAELSLEDAQAIFLERQRGPFTSIEDLYTRVALKRDVLDNLAMSGALDGLGRTSRGALWEIGALANKLGPAGSARPEKLFDLPTLEAADIPALPELETRERLTWDYLTHGSPRRHPMTLARRALTDLEIRPIATCRAFTESPLRPESKPHPILTIAGIVILRQMPPTANGVQFITLEDETGFIQCIAYQSVQARFRDILHKGAFIVRGEVQIAGAWRGMIIHDLWELDGMLGGYEGRPSAAGGMDRLVVERDAVREQVS